MKMKIKVLLAAMALGAAVGPANATIANSATGNGELFFTVWDTNGTAEDYTDDRSYTRDLGVFMNDWASSLATPVISTAKQVGGYTETYSSDSLLTGFLSAPGTIAANIFWNVAAVDSNGRDRVLVTAKEATPMPNNINFRQWAQSGGDSFLAAVNGMPGHVGGIAVNGSSIATPADGNALASGAIWGDDLGGWSTFNVAGNIGEKLNFYMLAENGTGNLTTVLSHQYANAADPTKFATWELATNGTLTYQVAAVPEAETWAMFGAGLLMVGAIARRRMAS